MNACECLCVVEYYKTYIGLIARRLYAYLDVCFSAFAVSRVHLRFFSEKPKQRPKNEERLKKTINLLSTEISVCEYSLSLAAIRKFQFRFERLSVSLLLFMKIFSLQFPFAFTLHPRIIYSVILI